MTREREEEIVRDGNMSKGRSRGMIGDRDIVGKGHREGEGGGGQPTKLLLLPHWMNKLVLQDQGSTRMVHLACFLR